MTQIAITQNDWSNPPEPFLAKNNLEFGAFPSSKPVFSKHKEEVFSIDKVIDDFLGFVSSKNKGFLLGVEVTPRLYKRPDFQKIALTYGEVCENDDEESSHLEKKINEDYRAPWFCDFISYLASSGYEYMASVILWNASSVEEESPNRNFAKLIKEKTKKDIPYVSSLARDLLSFGNAN